MQKLWLKKKNFNLEWESVERRGGGLKREETPEGTTVGKKYSHSERGDVKFTTKNKHQSFFFGFWATPWKAQEIPVA